MMQQVPRPRSLVDDRAPRLGEMLCDMQLISSTEAVRIAVYAEAEGMRFGEAAVRLGLVDPETISSALTKQYQTFGFVDSSGLDLASVRDPQSAEAEDYRMLAAKLKQAWFKPGPAGRALAVIGPERCDGRSTVVANLALCFAQSGRSTLIIDTDMRFPNQHVVFGLSDRLGLAGYLKGHDSDSVIYKVHGVNNLMVVPVGGPPPDPLELLMRPAFEALINSAVRNFDVVLVDTPAAAVGDDYRLTAAVVGAAMLVTRGRMTSVKAAAKMTSACRQLDVALVGGISLDGIGK